jgi:hypothetical protein
MPTPKTGSFVQSIWAALFGDGSSSGIETAGAPASRTLEEERARIRRENPLGLYQGRHYTEYIEDIRRLKKTDPAQAGELLRALIDVIEAEAKARRWKPAPAYYEHLAILLRKRKDFGGEVAILERHEQWFPGGASSRGVWSRPKNWPGSDHDRRRSPSALSDPRPLQPVPSGGRPLRSLFPPWCLH